MAFLLQRRSEAAEVQGLILGPVEAAVQSALARRPLLGSRLNKGRR